MNAARTCDTPRRRATRYRDGLAIALLAARPLRRRNLAGLRLGEHLVERGDGWWLEVPDGETKTGSAIRMPLPRALVPRLGTYLREHRPVLAGLHGRWAGPVGDALWVSGDGSPMTEMALYDRIVAHTRAAFGRSVNPHLFRDCAATSVAIHAPERIHIASTLLSHRTLASVERHYNQARMGQALRRFQAVMIGLRQGTLVLPGDAGEEDGAPDDTDEVG